MLKRNPDGVVHCSTAKHTRRYVNEFAAKYITCMLDTIEQMTVAVVIGIGKRLPHLNFIGPKHTRQPRLPSPAD